MELCLIIPRKPKLESTMGPWANPFISGQCYKKFMIHMSLQVCFRASEKMLELSPYKQTRVLIKLDH